MTTKENVKYQGIQVIHRAAEILRILAKDSGGLSLGQIAAQVQLPRSTVQRIIATLSAEDLVAIGTNSGGIRLGPEIQNRARDHLDRENEKLDAQRKEMGVGDDLAAMEGLTPAMLVRLGENDIKSLEDFAGCVTDDLTGWFETVERRRVRQEGILDGFDINAEEAENMIMAARVEAGWITQAELDQQRADEAARAAEEAAAAAAEEAGDGAQDDKSAAQTASDVFGDKPTAANSEAASEAAGVAAESTQPSAE
jgi:DNA-binding MarR family transcriptional regulator